MVPMSSTFSESYRRALKSQYIGCERKVWINEFFEFVVEEIARLDLKFMQAEEPLVRVIRTHSRQGSVEVEILAMSGSDATTLLTIRYEANDYEFHIRNNNVAVDLIGVLRDNFSGDYDIFTYTHDNQPVRTYQIAHLFQGEQS